jgi:hypothetical protein
LRRHNLVVLNYISASEFWFDKRVVFGGSGLIRGVATLEGAQFRSIKLYHRYVNLGLIRGDYYISK